MKKENMSVLSVKYKMPSPRNHYIIREKLMNSLRDVLVKRVTIVKAGAGSGKTTLLTVFIREQHMTNVKWITLDDSMNQVFLFWSYLLEALEMYITDGIDSLRCSFDGNIQKEMLEQMIPVLASKISREKDVILVLDDFHWIQDEYLLKTLDTFIGQVPENFHLVILSRQMPGIYLGSLHMEGSLLLVDEEQMRLTSEECRQFLTQTLAVRLGQEQIADIVDNANGWIGGAQLMAIARKTKQDHSAVYASADEQVIYEYIEREILEALSGGEKLFLKKTAILSYFNEEICGKYLPEYNFSHMMQVILEKNLFVINIDEEKHEYRYHAIMKECLLNMLRKRPEEQRVLQQRAAEIYYEMQDYEESVRLMFEGRDYEKLMECLLEMPQNAVTFSYMMQVPLPQIKKNVNFAYQYFFCHYAALEAEKCEQIYNYIKENMREDETFQAFRHADLFFDVNWEFHNISIMSREQIEAMPLHQMTKAYLLIKEAYFLFLADQMKAAMEYLGKARAVCRITNNVYVKCFVLAEETQILEQYGEAVQAFQRYREFKEMIREVPTLYSSYYIGIAGLYIKQMRTEEAKEALDCVAERMPRDVEAINSAYLYTLAEWYYITGAPEKTEEIILSLAGSEVYQSIFFSARLLRYPVYRGRNEMLAKVFLEKYDQTDEKMKNMDTELLYAGITFDFADREKALSLADTLTAKARKTGNKLKIIEGTLMMARFLWEMGIRGRRVQNLLLEALSYAVPEHLAQPFWFEKEGLVKILPTIGQEFDSLITTQEQKFLEFVLQPEESKEVRIHANPAEMLTVREMEVLEEIAKGGSNKEIAEHLCISLATVKTHLINIYGKLGVSNRMSAVNKMKGIILDKPDRE